MTEEKTKRRMRPGGGKAKGGAFEARIAKALSAALPLNFIKSPGSGARIGGKNFATIGKLMGEEAMKLFNADVVPVNESATGIHFRFSVECKCYATPDNFVSLVSGTANVFKWFGESVVDSAKIERQPILIFKWNQTKIFVAVRHDTFSTITPKLHIVNAGADLDIYEFDDLLKYPDLWINRT